MVMKDGIALLNTAIRASGALIFLYEDEDKMMNDLEAMLE